MFKKKKIVLGNIPYPIEVREDMPPDYVGLTRSIVESIVPQVEGSDGFHCYCKACPYTEVIDLTQVSETEIAKCRQCGEFLYWDTNIYDPQGNLAHTFSSVARGMKKVSFPFQFQPEELWGPSPLDNQSIKALMVMHHMIAISGGIPERVLYNGETL